MSNNKVTHLANPTANGNAINKSWTEGNYLKLSVGRVTGRIINDYDSCTSENALLSYPEWKAWFVQVRNHMHIPDSIWLEIES